MGIVTFSKLGQRGRIGNQMFQIAFCLAYAKRHGLEVRLPAWKYAPYFTATYPQGDVSNLPLATVKEPVFHYTPEAFADLDTSKNLDFDGYFQTEKYFLDCADLIRTQFTFKPEFIERVRQPYTEAFKKPVIAIHARRGDYVGNSNYEQLPALYYIKALENYMGHWRHHNLLFFSDDPAWLKTHFGCLPNAYFVMGKSDIEDLCLMSLCDHFVLANSSFSWWAAYLGEKSHSEIIRPVHHFAGALAQRCNPKDIYPPRWLPYDHKDGWRIDFTDVTFTIPVHRDHRHRKENLAMTLAFLQANFNTNFIIGEQGTDAFEQYTPDGGLYVKFNLPAFHRTKMLNDMAALADTPIVVNWDADVLLPPTQILEAVNRIRAGADMVSPYSGRFTRLPRQHWYDRLKQTLDIGEAGTKKHPILRPKDADSWGGAVFFNRESFFAGGGENENFLAFAPEDVERAHRFQTLGFDVQRVPGNIYHLEHHCGLNSSTRNPYFAANQREWRKVAGMNADELRGYVSTWAWGKKLETV